MKRVIILSLVVLLAACGGVNQRYCESDGECDEGVCDVSRNECVTNKAQAGERCAVSVDCTVTAPICDRDLDQCTQCSADDQGDRECAHRDPNSPVCSAGRCVECIADTDCSDSAPACDATTNRCVPCTWTGNGDARCAARDDGALCGPDGACVECLSSESCTTTSPVCGDDFLCRGCESHSECNSGLCQAATGLCVDEYRIVYVNGESASTATGCGSKGAPCPTLADASEKLNDYRTWLRISDGRYADIPKPAPGQTLSVVGIGSVTVTPTDSEIEVGAASDLYLENLTIDAYAADRGVTCVGNSDAQGSLEMLRVNVRNSLVTGVYSSYCTTVIRSCGILGSPWAGVQSSNGSLVVEGSVIALNEKYAITSSFQSFELQNNFIFNNGDPANSNGTVVVHAGDHPGVLRHNTIVFNRASSPGPNPALLKGAVHCTTDTGTVAATANIVWDNGGASQITGNCAWTYSNIEGGHVGVGNISARPIFVDDIENLRLAPGSPGIDAADPSGAPTHDFEGDLRPQGAGPDIGADEFVPL